MGLQFSIYLGFCFVVCNVNRGGDRDFTLSSARRVLQQILTERLIATDSVFSMDGDLAPLSGVCNLADRYDAVVMIEESHGTGHLGPTGRVWSLQNFNEVDHLAEAGLR